DGARDALTVIGVADEALDGIADLSRLVEEQRAPVAGGQILGSVKQALHTFPVQNFHPAQPLAANCAGSGKNITSPSRCDGLLTRWWQTKELQCTTVAVRRFPGRGPFGLPCPDSSGHSCLGPLHSSARKGTAGAVREPKAILRAESSPVPECRT